MTTIAGSFATAELVGDTFTVYRKKAARALPLTALSGVTFQPAKALALGLIRVELVASWTPPGRSSSDPNTVQFAGTQANAAWEAFADELRAAIEAAVPKLSLPIFSHHVGSGWPDAKLEQLDAVSTAQPEPTVYDVTKTKPTGPTLSQRLAKAAENHSSTLAGLTLRDGKLVYKSQFQPVHGASAHVSASGQIDRRATATRVIVGGALFGKTGAVVGALAKKKVDRRQLYLHINGERFTWAIPIDPDKERAAQTLAAKINTAARK